MPCSEKVPGSGRDVPWVREYLIEIYYELCKALGKDMEPVFGLDRPGDFKHSNAHISKARELLGYEPEWSFERGIKAVIEWYQENLVE